MPRTILLADDSLAVHRAVEKAFASRGDRIVVAASGDEAIDRFGSARPDVVLADIHMPGASGYEVASQVKSSSAETPVLLLVGTFEPVDEERVAASGADGYVLKPFDGARLLERVDALTGIETPAEAPGSAAEAADETEDEVAEVDGRGGAAEAAGSDREAEEPEAFPKAEGLDDDGATGDRGAMALQEGDIERIARRVVELLTSDVVERLAREVLPEVAEQAVRRRIEELESGAE